MRFANGKYLLGIFLVFIAVLCGEAQNVWHWAKMAGTAVSNSATGNGCITDNSGNVYVTGSFTGTVSFEGTNLSSSGLKDVFLAKYNFNGTLIWAISGGGTGNDEGNAIDIDNSGNIYITGYITDNVTFGASNSTGSGQDIFYAKFNNSGTCQWIFRIEGGSTINDEGNGITVDNAGSYLYITGSFNGTEDFNPSLTTTLNLSSQGIDIFIARYSASTGNYSWAKKAGSPSTDAGNAINIDASNNLVITGYFSETCLFGSTSRTSAGDFDIFIAKYNNTTGSLNWAVQAGGTQNDEGKSIVSDGTNVYVTGYFNQNAFFGTSTQVISSGNSDIFLAKYSIAGNFQWIVKAGGTNDDEGHGVSLDSNNNPVITGYYTHSMSFNNGAFTLTKDYNSSDNELFIAKYNPSGTFLWADDAGSVQNKVAYSVSVYNLNDIYVTGYFQEEATFSTLSLSSNGNSDAFTAKYYAPPPTITDNPDNQTVCEGQSVSFSIAATGNPVLTYQWYYNGGIISGATSTSYSISPTVVANSGSYYCIVTNSEGSTQSTTATLTVNPNPIITYSIDSINCYNNNNGIISISVSSGTSPFSYLWNNGATTSTLSGLGPGSYAVTVNDASSCTDSESFTLSQPTLLQVSLASFTNLNCYGNSNGNVNITITGGIVPYAILWSNGATTQNISGLTAGTYTVTVTDNHLCSQTLSKTLTQPSQIQVSGNVTNLTCFQNYTGSITTTVSGGITPYSFSWSNGSTTQNLSNISAGAYVFSITDANSCSKTTSFTVTQPQGITANYSAAPINCYGFCSGTCVINPINGTAPYSINFNGNIDNVAPYVFGGLCAGSYLVTITDSHQCINTYPVIITQQSQINSSSVISNIDCYGHNTGGINITVTGGVSPYNYLWSNSETTQDIYNLYAGTYTVSITDNKSCLRTFSYSVTQNPPINLNLGNDTTICVSDILYLTPGTFTNYLWQNGSTASQYMVNSSGTFWVSVTNVFGCNDIDSINISENPEPQIDLGNDTTIFSGSNIYLNPGFSPGCTYSWSTGNSSQCILTGNAGTYIITVTEIGTSCKSSDTINVNVDNVTCNANAGIDISTCINQSVSLNGTSNIIPVTYIHTCESNCNMSNSYCQSFGGYDPAIYGVYQKITSVSLNGTTNTSDVALYSDFTSSIFSVISKDSSYNLDITAWKNPIIPYNYTIYAYLDWNRDGDFNDANESYYVGISQNSGFTSYSIAITVPSFAVLGQTKMRIIEYSDLFAANPCLEDYDGETEDYKIEIIENLTYTTSVEWNGPNGFHSDSEDTTIFIDLLSQEGLYIFSIDNGNGCTDSDTLVLTVFDLPEVNLGADTTMYSESNVYLFAGFQLNSSILWSTGSTEAAILVSTAGTYSVTVLDTITGCTNNDQINVYVDQSSCNAHAPNDTSLCEGSDIVLNGNETVPIIEYTQVCSSNCQLNNSYCDSYGFDYGSVYGLQYLKITNVSLNGSNNISDSSLYSDFSASLFSIIEVDEFYTISVSCWSYVADMYHVYVFLDWNRDGDFDDLNESFYNVDFTSSTLYLNFTVPSNAVLGKTKMRIIASYDDVYTSCLQDFDGETEDYQVEIVKIQSYSPTYLWTGPNGFSSSNQNISFQNVDESIEGMYYFTISIGNCSSVDSTYITINQNPVIDLGDDQTACEGTTITLDAGANFVNYNWLPGLQTTQTITIFQAGIHNIFVTVIDSNNCTASNAVIINIISKPITNPIIHN